MANEIKTIISMNKLKKCKNVPSIIAYDMLVLTNFTNGDKSQKCMGYFIMPKYDSTLETIVEK